MKHVDTNPLSTTIIICERWSQLYSIGLFLSSCYDCQLNLSESTFLVQFYFPSKKTPETVLLA